MSSRAQGRTPRSLPLFLVLFVVVLALKWNTLSEPPFWDTAMGLFPAAITLAANGFDLPALLAMPPYELGGPNAHGTSPVTWITALVIRLMGGGTDMLVVLHLLHFAVAAWALLLLSRLATPVLGERAAWLLCAAVLLHPTFSVQVGYLYMEVTLFLCAVAAIHAWIEGRFWAAVAWGLVASAVKQIGIIVPATLVLATLAERRPLADKARRIGMIVAPPALWMGGLMLLRPETIVQSFEFGRLGFYMGRFLLNVPDLLAYYLLFAAAAVALSGRLYAAVRLEPTAPGARPPEQRALLVLGYSGFLIALFALLFGVVLPLATGFVLLLPRYHVLVLPFLLLWLAYGVKLLLGRRGLHAPALVLATLALLFVANRNGDLYPLDIDTQGSGNDPPLTERSNAYQRLLALQQEAMSTLAQLPSDVPVYYGLFEHFLFRYPTLGYARGPITNGHNLQVESIAPLVEGGTFPPCIYALYNYPWLGGEKIYELIQFAEGQPGLSAEIVREMRDGRYVILLIRIARNGMPCPTRGD